MPPLRTPSLRPALVVDEASRPVADSFPYRLGRPAPLGRERVVSALPLENGPRLLEPALVFRDEAVRHPADPSPVLIGRPAVRVYRMVDAGPTHDTRRIR